MSQPVTALVIMGVSGCGKSSVSEALCRLNGATAIEGDSFHPADSFLCEHLQIGRAHV